MLTTQEYAALELLERAGGELHRWPAPRTVAAALRDRHMVALTWRGERVALTLLGRAALAEARRPSRAGVAR
ncbi:MAG TPA: hypothetical protein VF995_00090 [Actinomycetota bacterium]